MSKFVIFVLIPFFSLSLTAQDGKKLERFWEIYDGWLSTHSEYECEVIPEMEIVHSRLHLWQIKKDSGLSDGIMEINADLPIPHEAYVFLTNEGDAVMNFPETDRTVLIYPSHDIGSPALVRTLGVLDLSGGWDLIKPFLIFEDLTVMDNFIVFNMILDANKMKEAGLIPREYEVNTVRMVFTLQKNGQPASLSTQSDDGDLETLRFDYISFDADEVHASFPKIENRSSSSITPDFTIKDALEEIYRDRNP